MSDPIDREALMRKFTTFVRAHGDSEPAPTWNDAVSLVGSMPSAQPERKRGKWIEGDYWSEGVGMGESYGNYYKCSICGKRVQSGYKHCDMNFCPYCGSDNREETEDAKIC